MPDPVLLSLADAKIHLRIPADDLDHDADITSKTAEASDAIREYLKARNDPLWDATTVPGPVRIAVEFLLTHLYEHRGDDMTPTLTGATPDEDVWSAIDRILKRSRDPALA